MKWIVFATLFAGCTDNANIGISNEPITCQQNAMGVANGTVSNPYTQKSYSFGATSASLLSGTGTAVAGVSLTDSALLLDLQFSCGMGLGNFDVGSGQINCPHLVNSTVSGNLQQVYGSGASGRSERRLSCGSLRRQLRPHARRQWHRIRR